MAFHQLCRGSLLDTYCLYCRYEYPEGLIVICCLWNGVIHGLRNASSKYAVNDIVDKDWDIVSEVASSVNGIQRTLSGSDFWSGGPQGWRDVIDIDLFFSFIPHIPQRTSMHKVN